MSTTFIGQSATCDADHRDAKAAHMQAGKRARGTDPELASLHFKAADAHHDATKDGDPSFERDAYAASLAVAVRLGYQGD